MSDVHVNKVNVFFFFIKPSKKIETVRRITIFTNYFEIDGYVINTTRNTVS